MTDIVRSIFITGGAGGMGLATARRFVDAGWLVGLYDSDSARVRAAAEAFPTDQVHAAELDVTDEHAYASAVAAFGERTGDRMDILFNNAGIAPGGWFDEMPLTTMRQIIEVNVWGVIVGTRVALPLLRNTQRALVMSTASVVATHGHALRAVYSASKFAVRGLTEALSLEFERFGIRTADVLPGCIDTPMLRGSLSGEPDGAFDVRLFDNLPKEGAFRVMPASAIADAVWNAYHGDAVHWYVPEEVGDIDRLKGTDYAAARESTRAFLFDRGRR